MILFSAYPYLALSLALFIIFVAGLVVFQGQRRLMLLSGLLSAPYALASVGFVPEYWNPVRVANFLTGPEDIIFSFANGGIVWLLSIWLVQRRVTLSLQTGRLFRRYIACTSSGVALILVCRFSGLGVMTSVTVSIVALGVLLLWRRGELWPIPVAGAIGFTLLYLVLTVAVSMIWPDYLMQWNADNLWGPIFLGVPLEEVVWAFGYGAVWPLLMAYVFDARLVLPGMQEERFPYKNPGDVLYNRDGSFPKKEENQ